MSIQHLINPAVGDRLLPLVASTLTLNNLPFVREFNLGLSGQIIAGVQTIGLTTNICGSFMYNGSLLEPIPSSVIAYQSVSGLGNKSVIISDIAGNIYYSAVGLVNPNGVVVLNNVLALPTTPVGLFVKVLNDNTGTILIMGLKIKF